MSKGRSAVENLLRGDSMFILGLGYFLTYIPYSFLAKSTTSGLLADGGPLSGFAVLPAASIATFLCLYLFVTLNGWWRYLGRRTVLGMDLPMIRWQAVLSGIGTAVVIGATTLGYSFPGVSIVFMMVLFRGGVLLIARITDAATKRRVRWESFAAFVLVLGSLLLALNGQSRLGLTPVAIGVVAAYLIGYISRFQVIHHLSKTEDWDARIRYFVEEQAVATPVFIIICAVWAFVGHGQFAGDLRMGYAMFFSGAALLPALLVGVAYAALYIFGTMIYLHPREYTFCVPVNRASSILSGVVASFAIALLFHRPAPAGQDLVSAGLLVLALVVLSVPTMAAALRRRPATATPLGHLFLFVCNGNTARSPIAQAICTSAMVDRLNIPRDTLYQHGVRVASAGLAARTGKPMKPEAIAALERLGVATHDHIAQPVTAEMIREARAVYCMTAEQRDALVAMEPSAAAKIHALGVNGELDEPVGHEATHGFAERMHAIIGGRIDEFIAHLQLAGGMA
ncbi:MAG: hypothetical protein ABIR47_15735 [Candidatus Kapaibacterium sp.]